MATNETLIPIPGRLHSVATEGHVAGADEIYDDTLQKPQSIINQEIVDYMQSSPTYVAATMSLTFANRKVVYTSSTKSIAFV